MSELLLKRPQILIALGSPSDVPKVLPQLPLDERADYVLSVASAHRTPSTVDTHMHDRVWDAVVAGAGMTNKLFHDYLVGTPWSTLVIALPIDDKATGGLTSRLSSQELPPGVAGVCVGMNALETAARLAVRLTGIPYSKVALYDFALDDKPHEKAVATLNALQVRYRDVSTDLTEGPLGSPEENELALALVAHLPHDNHLWGMDEFNRPVIATFYNVDDRQSYFENLGSNLGVVSFNGAENLALFGAKVVGRCCPLVQKNLSERFIGGASKYEAFKELIPLRSKEDIGRAVQLAKEAK